MPFRWRRGDPAEPAGRGTSVTLPPYAPGQSLIYRQAKLPGAPPSRRNNHPGSDDVRPRLRWRWWGGVAAAAQAGYHAGQAPAVRRVDRFPARQRAAYGVKGAQRVLHVGRILGLRPGGEFHAYGVGAPADVQHLPVDAEGEQDVPVGARTEPELVAVPAPGERPFRGR